MKKPKLTPWYPQGTKPVRKGVYEVEPHSVRHRAFAYWNGARFGWRCWNYSDTPNPVAEAYDMRNVETCLAPLVRWRGLAVGGDQ